MKNLYSSFLFSFLLLLIFNQRIDAQEEEFVIGAYMHSTPFGFGINYHPHDSSLFSLWRAKALGINTAMVYVRQPDADNDIHYVGHQQEPLPTNMEALRDFPNVIAMNHFSAARLLDNQPPNPPNQTIRNFDYIYFYSGAYYSKWDATQSSIPLGVLGLKHDIGTKITFNGKDYWSSGIGGPTGLLVKGPNYNQETRYRSSAYPTQWENDVQTYQVNYNMMLRNPPQPSQEDDPVCEIIVFVKYSRDSIVYHEPLVSKVLTAKEVGMPLERVLSYDYGEFCQNAFKSRDIMGLCQPSEKQLIDVEFRVRYLNPEHELLIDFIEVYDKDIWCKRLRNQSLQNYAKNKIVNYLQKFKAADPEFYANNLKYFFGVDEPHTVDAYVPHAFVQSVLDSLNAAWPE